MTNEDRDLADEGIERLEAAVIRGVQGGMTWKESINVHIDAVFATWPAAAALMSARISQRTEWRMS
jgi:hypothetical protein